MAWVIGKTKGIEANALRDAGYEIEFPSRHKVETMFGPIEDEDWDAPPADEKNIDDEWYGWAIYYVECNSISLANQRELFRAGYAIKGSSVIGDNWVRK